jgi:DNA-binding response OmpR family regulator
MGADVNLKKILVADDDAKVLRLMMLLLSREGFLVISAFDGYQAVQMACEHEPDVLLLDVNMPAGDGMSVQERLQKNASVCGKPVIYVTGDTSDEVQSRALKLGAFAVLHKPLQFSTVLSTVRRALAA